MSVSTFVTTLVVNPAFLEEIKDSNTTLWQRLASLRETYEAHDVRPSVLRRLVDLLNDVRDLLALQFALEESYGYIEVSSAASKRTVVVPSSPQHPLSAESIRAQHCSLYLMASDLAEKAEELQYRGWFADKAAELVQQVRQFDLQLQDHERAERQLLDASRQSMRVRR